MYFYIVCACVCAYFDLPCLLKIYICVVFILPNRRNASSNPQCHTVTSKCNRYLYSSANLHRQYVHDFPFSLSKCCPWEPKFFNLCNVRSSSKIDVISCLESRRLVVVKGCFSWGLFLWSFLTMWTTIIRNAEVGEETAWLNVDDDDVW